MDDNVSNRNEEVDFSEERATISNKERKRRERRAFAQARAGGPKGKRPRQPSQQTHTAIGKERDMFVLRPSIASLALLKPIQPSPMSNKAKVAQPLSQRTEKDSGGYDPYCHTDSHNATKFSDQTMKAAVISSVLPSTRPQSSTQQPTDKASSGSSSAFSGMASRKGIFETSPKPTAEQPAPQVPKIRLPENDFDVVSLPNTPTTEIEDSFSTDHGLNRRASISSDASWEMVDVKDAESEDDIDGEFIVIGNSLPSARNGKSRWWKLGY
ncbi:hypothetical protein CC80DRAFT_508395 [Byssothecium circinans]|uniref:Uncharacterized protein n=1 Tax=Byssothecium circinans TaxID=147558 RepID=A0A6A5TK22_9PLEO|nr:hypothetical protein CC80DRAFT_508395 [Byssothecium circinans]